MQSIAQSHEYSEYVSELKRWFPQDRSVSQESPVPPHTFEFALALAGAVSGGAGTGGQGLPGPYPAGVVEWSQESNPV
ncbi:hypothetical protein [Hahella chejuensis]|uniref:hypothetical protein n=1 Tax=Hahella chejuensis TaxID=158327 RepID=UPI00031DD919|nr:hypothetical protein [Hahella chejuensis]